MLEESIIPGSSLKLAKRHRKVLPGKITGECVWEPKLATPGTTGTVSLRFTVSGALDIGGRIVLSFPDDSWEIPYKPNCTAKLDPGVDVFQLDATYEKETLNMVILENDIQAGTCIEIVFSGITTPSGAMGQQVLEMTTFENTIVRKTVPVSTRGGLLVDGPTTITTSKILPGEILGKRTWLARNIKPGVVGDVSLEFQVSGRVQAGGKILIELCQENWNLPPEPEIVVKVRQTNQMVHQEANWIMQQQTLEIVLLSGCIPMASNVGITIAKVLNPRNQAEESFGRITTLAPNKSSVIDGPSKLIISKISYLSESEIQLATKKYQALVEEASEHVPISKLQELLEQLSVRLNAEQQEEYVVTDPIDVEDAPHLSKDQFLQLFAALYRPANRYGQDLRTACARNDATQVEDLIRRGCDPCGIDGAGWTSFHHAAAYGHANIIELLIQIAPSGKTIDMSDNSGWTALMCASANNFAECVTVLLKHGFKVDTKNAQGKTGMYI